VAIAGSLEFVANSEVQMCSASEWGRPILALSGRRFFETCHTGSEPVLLFVGTDRMRQLGPNALDAGSVVDRELWVLPISLNGPNESLLTQLSQLAGWSKDRTLDAALRAANAPHPLIGVDALRLWLDEYSPLKSDAELRSLESGICALAAVLLRNPDAQVASLDLLAAAAIGFAARAGNFRGSRAIWREITNSQEAFCSGPNAGLFREAALVAGVSGTLPADVRRNARALARSCGRPP
jgi:hypothetical protein